ncbi:hypothetical protein K2X33_16495 [bacterium]|nr:hypothetical protein [bacterium]
MRHTKTIAFAVLAFLTSCGKQAAIQIDTLENMRPLLSGTFEKKPWVPVSARAFASPRFNPKPEIQIYNTAIPAGRECDELWMPTTPASRLTFSSGNLDTGVIEQPITIWTKFNETAPGSISASASMRATYKAEILISDPDSITVYIDFRSENDGVYGHFRAKLCN